MISLEFILNLKAWITERNASNGAAHGPTEMKVLWSLLGSRGHRLMESRVVKELPSDIWHHLLLSSLNQKKRGRKVRSRLQKMSPCMSHYVRYFVIYLYIYIFLNNRRRSMATQQGYVRELWVELFLKHDDSWSNHLMWPDIMCTLSADFFCWTKAFSGLIQQNKTQWHSELSPAAYFLQFSEAQPEYQIPKIMPQVSTCWFAFADWDFEERFLHNKVSTGNWAKFDKLCWKHMSAAIPICSLKQSVILSSVLQQLCCLSINSVTNDNSTNVWNTIADCLCAAQRQFWGPVFFFFLPRKWINTAAPLLDG